MSQEARISRLNILRKRFHLCLVITDGNIRTHLRSRSSRKYKKRWEFEPSRAFSGSTIHHRLLFLSGSAVQGGKRGVAHRRSKANKRGAIDIPDSFAVHQLSDAAYNQRLVLRGCDFPARIGRSVRQRLELGEGGTLVLEQSVVGLPSSSLREMVPVGQSNSSQARETAIRELQAPKKKTIKKGSGVINQNTAKPREVIQEPREVIQEPREVGGEVDELLEALQDENVCLLDSQASSQFELLWTNGCVPQRNVMLGSDVNKNFNIPLYDLGCLGRCVIVPKCELPDLHIPLDCDACCLDMFWGTVVHEYYDPMLAIEMLSVLLFGPWGTYNVPEAVCKFVDENSVYGKV